MWLIQSTAKQSIFLRIQVSASRFFTGFEKKTAVFQSTISATVTTWLHKQDFLFPWKNKLGVITRWPCKWGDRMARFLCNSLQPVFHIFQKQWIAFFARSDWLLKLDPVLFTSRRTLGTRGFFSRATGGLVSSAVVRHVFGRRPKTRNRTWKASGTQGTPSDAKLAETCVSYEQNGFPVCCRNKRRNFTNNLRNCSQKTGRRRRNPVWKF